MILIESTSFDHTKGVIINLIENDSFEVGGWGDGQSPDDQALRDI